MAFCLDESSETGQAVVHFLLPKHGSGAGHFASMVKKVDELPVLSPLSQPGLFGPPGSAAEPVSLSPLFFQPRAARFATAAVV